MRNKEATMSVSASNTSNSTGVADLLQILSNSGASVLSSALTTSQLQSTLKDATPKDIAQISEQAIQLQQAQGLFSDSSSDSTTAATSLTEQILGTQYEIGRASCR